MSLSEPMARDLRAKYAEMLSMRIEHASGLEDRAGVRPRMADLAARFPGALREIDDLELGEIQRRIARLDAFLDASGGEEPWMKPMALFHALARGALAAKRWLGGRKQVDGALVSSFARQALASPIVEEIQAWAGDLASVASPPRGRVMDLVFGRLASELGVTDEAARSLVFGSSRRSPKPPKLAALKPGAPGRGADMKPAQGSTLFSPPVTGE